MNWACRQIRPEFLTAKRLIIVQKLGGNAGQLPLKHFTHALQPSFAEFGGRRGGWRASMLGWHDADLKVAVPQN